MTWMAYAISTPLLWQMTERIFPIIQLLTPSWSLASANSRIRQG
jgi:hypothetical protein